jgi:hypothetical protein
VATPPPDAQILVPGEEAMSVAYRSTTDGDRTIGQHASD